MTLVVRTSGDPMALLGPVARVVAAKDPNLPISQVATMDEVMATAVREQRFTASLMAGFAFLALLLSAIGVYAVIAYSVSQRTREIGIRLAVGARSSDILAQFLVEAVVLSVIGGAAGLGLGVGAGSALGKAMEWAVEFSPTAALVAFATSGGIGVVFGYFPARRAAQLDPIQALRHE